MPKPNGRTSNQPESAARGRPGPPSEAKFFLAVHQSKLGASKVFRVYPHADSLSFLYVCPPHPWIDLKIVRRLDSTHWLVRAAQKLRKGVALAIAGGAAAAGVLFWLLLKAAFRDASKVLDIVVFFLTAVAMAVPFVILIVTASFRMISSRVAHLDSLTDEQLRAEADKGSSSFRVKPSNVSDVSIDPVEPGKAKAAKGKTPAQLSFHHDPTGKWKLELVSSKDTKAAVRAFVQLLGERNVAVNVRLGKDGCP